MSADLNAALAELRAWEAADERGNLLVAELLDAIPEGAVLVAIPEELAREFIRVWANCDESKLARLVQASLEAQS